MNKKIWLGLIVGVLLMPQIAKAETIDQAAARFAAKDGNQKGYRVTWSQIAKGDLDGDNKQDAVVVYTVEHSKTNNYNQFMLILLSRGNSYRLTAPVLVGSKGVGAVREVSIDGYNVVLNGVVQGENDPNCCPSVPNTQYYHLEDGQPVED